MARIRSTSFVTTAHGRLGDVIIKTYRYGKVATRVPRMGPYLPTEKQRAGNDRWAAAGEYYHRVKADPVLRACYAKLSEKKGIPLSAITARDFMRPPVVREMDLAGYHGRPGDVITVLATDDSHVKAVEFTFRDAAGNVFEFGHADCPATVTWYYQVKCAPPIGGPITIEAVAIDLPGNRAALRQTWPTTPAAVPPPVPDASLLVAEPPLDPRAD